MPTNKKSDGLAVSFAYLLSLIETFDHYVYVSLHEITIDH